MSMRAQECVRRPACTRVRSRVCVHKSAFASLRARVCVREHAQVAVHKQACTSVRARVCVRVRVSGSSVRAQASGRSRVGVHECAFMIVSGRLGKCSCMSKRARMSERACM